MPITCIQQLATRGKKEEGNSAGDQTVISVCTRDLPKERRKLGYLFFMRFFCWELLKRNEHVRLFLCTQKVFF